MTRLWSIIIPTLLLITLQINGQEVITGAMNNPALAAPYSKHLKTGFKNKASLTLPFYDDFSSGESFPDVSLWENRYVFINNTFSTDQRTQGIATFDVLDENGDMYNNVSSTVFAADTLTSLPINLSYSASDSVYLSFLYEPGGIADMPEINDSLTLEFYTPSEDKWHSVWRSKGGGSNTFKTVMIGIKQTKYLSDGFRFRFTNYASLAGIASEPSKAGNADEWNLDCVILKSGRSVIDTVMHDVAFTIPQRSLLNNLEAMPWAQFQKASLITMGSIATLNYRNNDDIIRNPTKLITITDVYKDLVVKKSDESNDNLQPFSDFKWDEVLLYTYSSTSADSALFLVKDSLYITDGEDKKANNTLNYYQVFGNYFAYDDGSKEAGYGISGEGSDNAMVAVRYRSFMPDSVCGMSICFNDAYNNANRKYFYPVVWSDDNGKPGDILMTGDEVLASTTTAHNGFVNYKFSKPVYVDGYFWVGWKQESESYLNAGLDLNTPHLNRQYYWINGNWYASSAPGTVLLRAIMSGKGTGTSTDDNISSPSTEFTLYPNPSSGQITVSYPGNNEDNYRLSICNLSGSVVMQSDRITNVDISLLAPGCYFVVVKSASNKSLCVIKLIKTN
jgi:hypothetical protein